MTREEVAAKLAQITGKPITEFFNGTMQARTTPIAKTRDVVDSDKVESGGHLVASPEIMEYQALFSGSRIIKTTIHDGRQMTRKEYLAYTKNLTRQEICAHALLYKMFRAEGQLDPSFISWLKRFPEAEYECDEQE